MFFHFYKWSGGTQPIFDSTLSLNSIVEILNGEVFAILEIIKHAHSTLHTLIYSYMYWHKYTHPHTNISYTRAHISIYKMAHRHIYPCDFNTYWIRSISHFNNINIGFFHLLSSMSFFNISWLWFYRVFVSLDKFVCT